MNVHTHTSARTREHACVYVNMHTCMRTSFPDSLCRRICKVDSLPASSCFVTEIRTKNMPRRKDGAYACEEAATLELVLGAALRMSHELAAVTPNGGAFQDMYVLSL